jgi:hypothetical protein
MFRQRSSLNSKRRDEAMFPVSQRFYNTLLIFVVSDGDVEVINNYQHVNKVSKGLETGLFSRSCRCIRRNETTLTHTKPCKYPGTHLVALYGLQESVGRKPGEPCGMITCRIADVLYGRGCYETTICLRVHWMLVSSWTCF